MSGPQHILSIFIDARDFSTMSDQHLTPFRHLGDIQRKAWKAISKRLRSEFSPRMVLMDPIDGVFQDDQNREAVAQCLHSRDGFTPDVTKRFREVVLEAYSQVLGTQASCIPFEAVNNRPVALFRR